MKQSMILDRNISAANMMANGFYGDAIGVYSTLLHELLSQAGAPIDETYIHQGILIETIPCHPGTLMKSSPTPDDKEFTLYANTVVVLGCNETEVRDSSQLCRDLSAITGVYNMALANHLIALRSTEKQQESAYQALRLYEMALSLNESFLPLDANSFLEVVILNNIGHIYSVFFYDRERMYACVKCMARSLECMSYNFESSTINDIVVFHQTVVIYLGNFLPAAPAA